MSLHHARTVTDELIENALIYKANFTDEQKNLPLPPGKNIAIVACMDARLSPYAVLGLKEGDAHVIRNAGGVITAGDIRSLAISQRLLGTKEIILIHHTDCGMLTFTDDAFKSQICQEIGQKPHWSPESFSNLHDDVRQSINRIKADPFVPLKNNIRGFIYDVHTGGLEEVLPL